MHEKCSDPLKIEDTSMSCFFLTLHGDLNVASVSTKEPFRWSDYHVSVFLMASHCAWNYCKAKLIGWHVLWACSLLGKMDVRRKKWKPLDLTELWLWRVVLFQQLLLLCLPNLQRQTVLRVTYPQEYDSRCTFVVSAVWPPLARRQRIGCILKCGMWTCGTWTFMQESHQSRLNQCIEWQYPRALWQTHKPYWWLCLQWYKFGPISLERTSHA